MQIHALNPKAEATQVLKGYQEKVHLHFLQKSLAA